MLIFLDFDGVLHPDAVYLDLSGRVELRAEGELFMWADALSAAIEPYPEANIVLSTSWVRNVGFHRARNALPANIAKKVVGATWHSAMGKCWPDSILWDTQSRFEQIASYLSRLYAPCPWIAIDDDDRGWPLEKRSNLVRTEGELGLSEERAKLELNARLQALHKLTNTPN